MRDIDDCIPTSIQIIPVINSTGGHARFACPHTVYEINIPSVESTIICGNMIALIVRKETRSNDQLF